MYIYIYIYVKPKFSTTFNNSLFINRNTFYTPSSQDFDCLMHNLGWSTQLPFYKALLFY